jgi:siroheme decarboxylase
MHSELFLLSDLEFRLLNQFQRDFPLRTRPFSAVAKRLGADEATVISALQRLQRRGLISRLGAVFRPNTIGASALAALAVPPGRIEAVAHRVNAYAQVNHNYEREHRFNLWFVVTAPSHEQLRSVLQDIEQDCGCGPAIVLPMLDEYHIDLGFDLSGDAGTKPPERAAPIHATPVTLTGMQEALVAALQNGLPVIARPFAAFGLHEQDVIATIAQWLDEGVVKRFGVIVKHHELGYTANAMAVWDVPDDAVGEVGRRIAESGAVTLCYRRQRSLPDWPYNLFCMIHGRDREDVVARIAALSDSCGTHAYAHQVLFSRRRFKQRGAHYAALPELQHG